jgi:hypothetical protein
MYESNGPDVKIRGNASHIAEKYLQLARDAQSSGDPIAAENYYQHAEHYFRLIAAAQEHLRQTQPTSYQQQPQQGGGGNYADDSFDDGDGDQPPIGGEPYAPQQQSFYPREQPQPQFQQPHQQPQHHQQPPPPQQQPHFQPRQQHFQPNDEDVERLPSFITGGQPQPSPPQMQGSNGPNNQNGQNGYDGSADRFPLHRRRRRHRGPRDNSPSGEGDAPMSSGGPQIEE